MDHPCCFMFPPKMWYMSHTQIALKHHTSTEKSTGLDHLESLGESLDPSNPIASKCCGPIGHFRLPTRASVTWQKNQLKDFEEKQKSIGTLLGTNIYHPKGVGKMSFLSHWWDIFLEGSWFTTRTTTSLRCYLP